MKKTLDMVREFHAANGQRISHYAHLPHEKDRVLRRKLLREEVTEYFDAEDENDLAGIADAIGDIIVILCGTALAYGVPLPIIIEEIHRANMSKMDENGNPIINGVTCELNPKYPHGKILKGPGYTPPDIEGVLRKWNQQMARVEARAGLLPEDEEDEE